MKFIGNTTIETHEEPDQLLFIMTKETGWLTIVAVCVLVAAFVFFFWPDHKLFVIFGIVISIFGWITSFTQGNVTRLVVSEHKLEARGNLSRLATTAITIGALDIKSIGYSTGGEDDPTGLYVHQSGQSTCVFPGINREQAEAIVQRIRQRYPNLERGDTNPNSLLFSGDGGITRINLTS